MDALAHLGFRHIDDHPVVRMNDHEGVEHGSLAIQMANQSPYGLGASIWTQDTDRAKEMAGRLECGVVFVNQIVKSDPRLPFGGVKRSGFGRELARVGIHEMVNVKSVWID